MNCDVHFNIFLKSVDAIAIGLKVASEAPGIDLADLLRDLATLWRRHERARKQMSACVDCQRQYEQRRQSVESFCPVCGTEGERAADIAGSGGEPVYRCTNVACHREDEPHTRPQWFGAPT